MMEVWILFKVWRREFLKMTTGRAKEEWVE